MREKQKHFFYHSTLQWLPIPPFSPSSLVRAYGQRDGGGGGAVFGGVGALGGADAALVGAGPVDVILRFDDVGAFWQHPDEILGGAVAVVHIVAAFVAAQRVDGLHAGRTLVVNLHVVEVALRP